MDDDEFHNRILRDFASSKNQAFLLPGEPRVGNWLTLACSMDD